MLLWWGVGMVVMGILGAVAKLVQGPPTDVKARVLERRRRRRRFGDRHGSTAASSDVQRPVGGDPKGELETPY